MTKQNWNHRDLCRWEKYHKGFHKLILMHRWNIKKNHKYHNRKFWRQVDKDFDAKCRKEQMNG